MTWQFAVWIKDDFPGGCRDLIRGNSSFPGIYLNGAGGNAAAHRAGNFSSHPDLGENFSFKFDSLELVRWFSKNKIWLTTYSYLLLI